MSEFKLDTSSVFDTKIKNLGRKERKAVFSHFISTFGNLGFHGLQTYEVNGYSVRNKKSDNVSTDHPEFIKLVKYAQEHYLWHFHVGFYDFGYDIDGYELSPSGDLTSQWVVHYQLFSETHINVVDLTPHPPFELPPEEHFD